MHTKYKIVFLAAIFCGATFSINAQTYTNYSQNADAEADAIINLLGVKKRQAISVLVPLEVKDSAAFWKLYDEYEQIQKKVAKSRLALYERTAQSYANMTPTVADSLAKQYFVNRTDQENLAETYYKKIKTATNAVVAFEFYQAEAYLLTQLRAQIMQQIPTYGQLVRAAANK